MKHVRWQIDRRRHGCVAWLRRRHDGEGPSECSRRTCEPGGAHAFAGACATLAWHKARACKVCAPSSVALASIALALARACGTEQCRSTGSTRGTSPHPCRQWRAANVGGTRGTSPHPCRPTACLPRGARCERCADRGVGGLSRGGRRWGEYSRVFSSLLTLTSQRSRQRVWKV